MEKEKYSKIRDRTLRLYRKSLLWKHLDDISGGIKQVPLIN